MINPPPHLQEICFDNGTRLTLDVAKIEQGNWYHILANGGKEYIVNPDRILFVKVYKTKKTDYEVQKKG